MGDRICDAIFYATEWLFRHQIWEKTKKKFGEGIWIGPEEKSSIKKEHYLSFLNPVGACRCGSNKKYADCCMKADLKSYSTKPQSIMQIIKHWKENIQLPEKKFLETLKEEIYHGN